MALSFSASTANAMLAVITSKADLGASAAIIRIYSGTMPATADTALAGNTVLAELTCSDPSAAAPSSKTLTFSSITQDTSANASGTATFFRLMDSDFNVVLQGNVTATAGGGALELNTVSIVAGGPVQITSATLTLA